MFIQIAVSPSRKQKNKFMRLEEDFDARLSGDEVVSNAEKSSWYKRKNQGILTSTKDKKDAPEGIWAKCSNCQHIGTAEDLANNLFVCPQCDHHHRIGSEEYFDLLFDAGTLQELFANVRSKDQLGFVDLKPYNKRLEETYAKSNIHDSMTVGHGKVNGLDMVIACMDFEFIGGSLGSVMGEKISRACDYCVAHRIPFMIINKSGGARMMESAFSLMQLAKTSGKLSQLSDAQIPYFSMCTDPTFGGTTASFAMLGDVIFAEPDALIGFAGPRVIKETIKKDLPPGFQRSEFLLEHGFLDFIVHRKDLKARLTKLLQLFK
jgi:acetyl-CoA carboxylase carboxyl transferase subunit beta